ncbi:hypothetical protein BDY24DRAFT_338365, partial [Mrakia frigida]|uniref:uncharacterized protein n=1 Tax=Mrakia frigida TaxID=29902 RepID=UPI003FCBFAB6
IFYESELLAVVHRSKSKETGLVSSKVWAWVGRKVEFGGKRWKKMEEIAKRLSVGVVSVKQGEEIEELMGVLGGTLVIRQGERDHFSSDNTSLYTVQQRQGSFFVDEVDLLPSSLTSRHPLVLTVLSQVFLYHARGTLRSERSAGRQYAALLAKGSPSGEVIELEEGGEKTAEDELFWMCFGEEEEGEGSRAHHWKWRAGLKEDEMRGWSVEEGKVLEMDSFSGGNVFGSGVKILLLSFELFVVVAEDARGRRHDLRLALHVAERISRSIRASRPFNPPVHALVLPSKVPADLKPYFRYLDEDHINGGRTPSHMNVLSLVQAEEHLAQGEWSKAMLVDETFLPLGVAPRSG